LLSIFVFLFSQKPLFCDQLRNGEVYAVLSGKDYHFIQRLASIGGQNGLNPFVFPIKRKELKDFLENFSNTKVKLNHLESRQMARLKSDLGQLDNTWGNERHIFHQSSGKKSPDFISREPL